MEELNLRTGDIILCDYIGSGFFGLFSKLLKYFMGSKYTHIGMVLKDSTFIDPPLKGIYIWESSWEGTPDPQDGKVKLGVQITPFETFCDMYSNGDMYIRRIECDGDLYKSIFNNEILNEIHGVVYNKPYDIVPTDWLEAYFRKDSHPQKTDRFWCSAFIGYIFNRLGLISNKIDWGILRPIDFSTSCSGFNITLEQDIKLSKEEKF